MTTTTTMHLPLALLLALSAAACGDSTTDGTDSGTTPPGDTGGDFGVTPPGDTGPPLPTGTPVLVDFRIEDARKDRVLFDASADITGMTIAGFVIADRTITSVTIDDDRLGGYFTVSPDFDFWDNDAIRLGEIEDADYQETLHNFSLTYIDNAIPEPASTISRYVTPAATGGGDGLTEATAWTWDEAASNAVAGMTVWAKAGAYDGTAWVTFSADGTRDEPIKWVGYKSTPGDVTANYLTSYEDIKNGWDTSELPTLIGPAAPTNRDIALLINGADWNVFRNIQVERFGFALRTTGGGSAKAWDGLVVDNFNSRENVSASDRNMSGINIRTGEIDTHHFIRIENSVFLNHTMAAIAMIRDDKMSGSITHFLIDNVRAYSDYLTEPEREDYFIAVSGHYGIVRNCQTGQYNDRTTGGSVHGIGVRGQTGDGESTYILIEGNEVFNVQEGIYVRNSGSNRNVFKHNRVHLGPMPDVSQGDTGGIVMAWGGCDYNLFEDNIIERMAHGIWIRHNSEDATPAFGKNNIVRNNVFTGNQTINANSFIYASSTSGGAPAGDNSGNLIYNNTVVEYRYFYSQATPGVDGNLEVEVRNNIFRGFTFDLPNETTLGPYTFVDNLINDTIGELDAQVGSGGNFDADPQLDGDFRPEAPLSELGVPMASGVYYDYGGQEREATTTVGAVMSAEE